jgi:4-hydroxybenzoate polyprenyltransferase
MALTMPLPTGTRPILRFQDLAGVLLCMIFARSAAMAFNRLIDARLDAANPRTATRHLPAGKMTRWQVGAFTVACGIGFVASTLLFLPNRLPLLLSVPVLAFLCGYSFAKRFTMAAHLWLGVALSLSPLCAWIAIRGEISMSNLADWLAPLILAAAVAAWVTGFDLLYACQDADYDARVGLHSVPAKLGVNRALRLALMCHVLMLVLLATLPWLVAELGLGWLYWGALVLVAGLVLRQHSLVRPDDLQRVNQAFFDTNAAISLVLLVAGTVDTLFL